jgi:hypothetical protein
MGGMEKLPAPGPCFEQLEASRIDTVQMNERNILLDTVSDSNLRCCFSIIVMETLLN